MAAEEVAFSGGEPGAGEMNGVAQLLAWLVIKHKLYHHERYAKWHNALFGRPRKVWRDRASLFPAVFSFLCRQPSASPSRR